MTFSSYQEFLEDELWDEEDVCVRIKIVSYEQTVYYVKMINGEIAEFKKVGVVK